MPLITLGDDTKLKLKIPSKGDVDWSDDFKTQFAQKIVDHDHTGLDGKGAKLTGDSLVDGAINRASLLAINLEDLPNVTDAPGNGQTLIYNEAQGRWNAQLPTSDIQSVDATVAIPNAGFSEGLVVITTDIDNNPNPQPGDDLTNRYILNFINNGSVNISEYSGITFIIEDTAPAGKIIKFPNLSSCTIISNVDVEFHGTVENCKVLVRRPNGTAKTSLLSNGKFEGSVCDLDELVSAGHASSLTRFVQSSITTDILETQMTGTDVENIEKTNLKVGSLLNNSALSTGTLRLNLTDKSSLDFKSSSNITLDGTTINLSADSKLTTLADIGSSNSQIVKTWDDTANRWQYLVSPSGTGKVIVSDNNEPSEVDFTLGNLTNVNLTSPANNQVLTYSGGNWIDNKKLEVNVVGNKDIDTTNASGTQILRYDGSSKFTPQTLTIPPSGIRIHDAQTFVKTVGSSSTNTVNIGSNEYAVFSFACANSGVYGAANREIIVADSTTIVFTQSGYTSTVSVGGVVVAGNNGTTNSSSQCALSVVVYENGS